MKDFFTKLWRAAADEVPSPFPRRKGLSEAFEAEDDRRDRGDAAEAVLVIAGMTLLAIIMIGLIGGFLRHKADAIAIETEPSASPSIAPTEAAIQLPRQPPPDLTGLWIGAGIAGAVLVLLILAVGLAMLVKRSRHGALKLRQEQAAEAEDRRQALLAWTAVTQTHQRLKDKALEVETDWDMLFSYPVLVDATVPTTAAFHRALRAADSISPEAPAGLHLGMDITSLPYPQRVEAAEEAWLAAWDFAKRTGTKLLPAEERKTIEQIVQLLGMARDSGGSDHERAVAYERVQKLIGDLQYVRVPDRALQAIAAEVRPMLEAAPMPVHS